MSPAPLEELRVADAQARQAAQTVFDRPLVLEAGAGTGKTAVLVARVLAWCLGPGWDRAAQALGSSPDSGAVAARALERVVALTFTDKAAAEMANRVAEGLRRLLAGAPVQSLSLGQFALPETEFCHRVSELLASLDRFNAGTIHSFCRRLLSLHPLEAGLHPGFEVDATGLRLRAIVEEVVAEAFRSAFEGAGDDAYVGLAKLEIGPDRIADTVHALVERGVCEAALAGDPSSGEELDGLRRRVASGTLALLDLIDAPLDRASPRIRTARKVPGFLRRLRQLALEGGDVAALQGFFRDPDHKGVLKKVAAWSRQDLNSSEREVLGDHQAQIAEECAELSCLISNLGRVDLEILGHALAVLRPLLQRTWERLQREGVMTFSALLTRTRDLLVNHASVAESVRRSIDQLLVDEFQDTDPLQYEIVARLALDGSVRPGLFLVGDPKQSIYGWRNADLAAYADFLDRVKSAGGAKQTLVVNWRSGPGILDEVARLMGPVMQEERGVQPAFEPLLPGRDQAELPGERYPVEHWVSQERGHAGSDTKTHAERARELEAQAVARDLQELHNRHGVPWNRAAILLRSLNSAEIYAGALREAGIPYLVERDRSFYRRREVIDLVSVLRTIFDPHDHVAFAGFLRSPLVGVPDAALIPLWTLRLPEAVTVLLGPDPARLRELDAIVVSASQRVPLGIPGLERIEGWELSLKSALRTLAVLRQAARTEPADRSLEMLRHLLVPDILEGARFRGDHRLANLERLLQRALLALISPRGGVDAVLRELRRALEEGQELAEAAPGDAHLDAVRIMTIHLAKGLTFDQVYLVGLHDEAGRRAASRPDEAVPVGDGWQMQLFDKPSLNYDLVEMRRHRVSAAERVRLLYVATTRASKRLVLAGKWSKGGRRRNPQAASSLADLVSGQRNGVDPVSRLLAADGPLSLVDAEGVLWVLAGPHLPDTPPPVATTPLDLDPKRVRAEAASLSAARQEARRRMGRRLTSPVTALAGEGFEETVGGYQDRDEEDLPASLPAAGGRGRRALGLAVHRVLEVLDLSLAPAESLPKARQGLREWLAAILPEEELETSWESAVAFLERLKDSALVRRLVSLQDHVLARELPLLVRNHQSTGPTGAAVGKIDLLYQDPVSGDLVVADFKTEEIPRAALLEERVQAHVFQGRLYAQGVQWSLGLSRLPRVELWFLEPDVLHVVPT